MAILRVEFDNILCFKKFEADFTYPKKLVKSNLENEFLLNYPNIRYKKVNILIGSNASGKTSLGKAILTTFLFIRDKEAKPLKDLVSNINKKANILMDCVFSDGVFFRFEAIIQPSGLVDVRYRKIKLLKNDTYESALERLPEVEFKPHTIALSEAVTGGWYFNFPSIDAGFGSIVCKVNPSYEKEFVQTLNLVLKTFDPSIIDVYKSIEAQDTYVIRFNDGRVEIVRHGYLLNELRQLSSGTKYAINIANVIFSIKKHQNGFYYVDEQFSYVNSDIEIACLNTMIELLGDGEQLFFTTHNEEIMNLPYPLHAFSFVKKEQKDNNFFVELINAAQFEKRNNVTVKNLYDNDYFDISPDVSKVFKVVA